MALVTHHYHLESQPAAHNMALPVNGWYLLRVPVREERRAISQLQRLAQCDYVTIWTTTTRHYDRSRKRQSIQAFLPGHIFLRTEQHTRDELFTALRSVIGLTCLHDQPHFSCELAEFCKLVLAADNDTIKRPGYATGTMVEVIAGPLCGCRGRVIKHRGAWELVVGITILGTTVASRIDLTAVQELT